MNPEIISDNQPAKGKRSGGGRAFHSRLEPFVDFIRELRQRRKTWQEIAALCLAKRVASSPRRAFINFTGVIALRLHH